MKIGGMGWAGIVRLGLVQASIGAIVALTTSTLNRVMVVEAAMPAMLPAALVAWHYVIQLSRPRWGHGSDLGHRRTPWIVGGMAVLALGGVLAADATVMMSHSPALGIIMGVVAFSLIGAAVGASGTSLLALLATSVAPSRRPAAASITWIMMVVGIVITAGVAGAYLQPYSEQRLALAASAVSGICLLITLGAMWRLEGATVQPEAPVAAAPKPPFAEALKAVWSDPLAKRFTLFVFVSMTAYSAQDLILEPFAGLVFGMNPGQSTQMSSVQHGGVLLGIILVGLLGVRFGGAKSLWMRRWTIAGCIGSAGALGILAAASMIGPAVPLAPIIFTLGLANGVFAVAAIGSMMGLAGAGGGSQEGLRMGVWGAAQALAFAFGGFIGATGVDVLRSVLHQTGPAFMIVFVAEALLFLVAAVMASRSEMTSAAASALVAAEIEFGGAH